MFDPAFEKLVMFLFFITFYAIIYANWGEKINENVKKIENKFDRFADYIDNRRSPK